MTRGILKARFLFTDGTDDLNPRDFRVADGDVYQLVWDNKKDRGIVIKYDANGQLKSKTVLDEDFLANGTFGVFKSGEYLVAATDANDPKRLHPYTAVFDASGKLLKRVTFDEDDQLVQAITGHDESHVPSNQRYSSNVAITYGAITAASDGNLYLMRHTTPASIYVISPAGKIVRHFTVDSGDRSLVPRQIFESAGQLAVAFVTWATNGKKSTSRIKVVNASTGEVQRTFDGSDELGAAIVCYEAPDRFTYLVPHKNTGMALAHVGP